RTGASRCLYTAATDTERLGAGCRHPLVLCCIRSRQCDNRLTALAVCSAAGQRNYRSAGGLSGKNEGPVQGRAPGANSSRNQIWRAIENKNDPALALLRNRRCHAALVDSAWTLCTVDW